MSDSVPFVLLSEGTGTGDCVMSDAIPFVSLSAGTGTGETAPQAPTIRGCQEFCVFRLTNRI